MICGTWFVESCHGRHFESWWQRRVDSSGTPSKDRVLYNILLLLDKYYVGLVLYKFVATVDELHFLDYCYSVSVVVVAVVFRRDP